MTTALPVIELDEVSVVSYLRERGLVPADAEAQASALSGGISNVVIRVTWDRACLVVKQSLPKLRVEADWPFNRGRIAVEERCMRYLGDLLGNAVPEVVDSDLDNFTFVMTCAPPGGVLWKQALLDGNIDLVAAERAGLLLGRIHTAAADDPLLRERFSDQTVLLEGRVDPYHLTAAAQHPDLAAAITAEVERLLATRETLVLGDYCPKNTFVYPDRLFILDFEVAHWGDPAFDIAFCINHLILKACHFPDRGADYLAAAATVWSAYSYEIAGRFDPIEQSVIRELGCLLLARIDGKSKIEYITDAAGKDLVRASARELLLGRYATVSDSLALVQQQIDGLAGRCL
jgi:5-methylthioribose kinase